MNEKKLQKTDEIKLRLLEFAKSQKIPMGEFYEKIQCHPSTFSGKGLFSALSGQTISEIINKFPDLNSDWLLLGRGEMLRSLGQNVGNITHGTAVGVNVNGNDISITNNNPLLPTVEHLCESVRDLTTQNTQLLTELSRLIGIIEKKLC